MFSGGAHGWNIDLGNRKAKELVSTTLSGVRNRGSGVKYVLCTLLGPEGPGRLTAVFL